MRKIGCFRIGDLNPLQKYAVLSVAVVPALLLAIITLPGGLAGDLPGTGADAGKTVVYRDTWGVPHIYAPTVEAGLYAMGWAQAEDRPEELLKNLLRGVGEISRLEGPGAVQADLIARMWDHYGVGQRNLERLRPDVKGHLEAFVRGINDYYQAYPEERPEWWGERRVEAAMVIAFSRFFLYGWSISQAFGDLRRGGVEPGGLPEFRGGSNQWAVAPSRSAEGAAILLIDPHLSWWGASRFWEFRIHAGELKGSGFTLPATPYIGLGHNERVAWAMTTGGPDTADVYELTLHAEDPGLYLYDGEWRRMTSREVTLEVRETPPQKFTLWSSHHGPVVAWKDGKAYAARSAYAEEVQGSEAWYELNFARDYRGAVAALNALQVFPQNVMVADTDGNIYYQRTGRVPRRPEGFDWSRPVNGSTSATEWTGFHPASELVQILNPPQGYMQNCNIPPDAMMVDSPMTPDTTRPYLYSDASYGPSPGGWTQQRGARAVELLEGNDSVTVEEALAYALDVRAYGFERWLELLGRAGAEQGAEVDSQPEVREALRELLGWDGEVRRDSSAALKYFYWRQQLPREMGDERYNALARRVDFHLAALGQTAPPVEAEEEELRMVVQALIRGLEALEEDHESLAATYGDKFRVGRDDASWPVGGGGDGGLGLASLRNVGYSADRKDKARWGQRGQTATQVVVLSRPIRSWTATPIGQSDRPDSPHYRDQAEKLFSPRLLKPSWWRPEELAGNIASRTVLDGAP